MLEQYQQKLKEFSHKIRAAIEIKRPDDFEKIADELKASMPDSITLTKDALKKGVFIELGIDIKSKLIAYFYLRHNRFMNSSNPDFLSQKEIAHKMGLRLQDVNWHLEQFQFTAAWPCTICKQSSNFSFYNLKSISISSEQICTHCSHINEPYVSEDCTCKYCTGLMDDINQFLYTIPKMLNGFIADKINSNTHLEEKYSDKKLKWFAEKFSSNLSKNARMAISYIEHDFNEVKDIFPFDEISNLKDELEKQKVIIIKKKIKPVDEIKYCMLRNTFPFHVYLNRNEIELISDKISAETTIAIDKYNIRYFDLSGEHRRLSAFIESIVFSFENDGIKSSVEVEFNQKMELGLFFSEWEYLAQKNFYDEVVILNPYFFDKPVNNILPEVKGEFVKSIFNSPQEKNQYYFLTDKYPLYLVVPNVIFRNFVKVDELKGVFAADELKQVQYCIIDFVLFNKEGMPVKAIELQKGDHHNRKEWIKKDRLKKKAIEAAGILYEEIF